MSLLFRFKNAYRAFHNQLPFQELPVVSITCSKGALKEEHFATADVKTFSATITCDYKGKIHYLNLNDDEERWTNNGILTIEQDFVFANDIIDFDGKLLTMMDIIMAYNG